MNQPSKYLKISIILPTYAEQEILTKTYSALEAQDYPHHLLEIIIIDDHGPIEAHKFIPLHSFLCTKIIRHPYNKGRSAARNTGILHASGSILLFLDSDIIPQKNTVRLHAEQHSQKGKTVCLGSVRWHPEIKQNNFTRYARWFEFDTSLDKSNLSFTDFTGAHFSIKKKDIYQDKLLFDENFINYGMEDIEFAYNLQNAGFSFHFIPDAVGLHYRTAELDEQIARSQKTAVSLLHFLKKHPNQTVFNALKVIPAHIYTAFSDTLRHAQEIAMHYIIEYITKPIPTKIEQEVISLASIFLIESAPWNEVYADAFISQTAFESNSLKSTIIDWGLRMHIFHMIFHDKKNADYLYTTFIHPLQNTLLKQSLCHEAARYYILLDDTDNAHTMLKTGLYFTVPENKDLYLIHYLIGSLQQKAGNYSAAEKHFLFVISKGKNYIHLSQYASALYHLGEISLRWFNEPHRAESLFRHTLELVPDHQAAKTALAQCVV
ncbi:glycosyltransferase family 2 protein [bacterium]|nr:glycosyltransferase family 2 protein [bacterium]MCP5462923.1 glycosyltransferase family 2 protein [bacterium]